MLRTTVRRASSALGLTSLCARAFAVVALRAQDGPWNYNFQGVKHSTTMNYSLRLDVPLEFYHELHRPSHFLNFSNIEDAHVEADREDLFE